MIGPGPPRLRADAVAISPRRALGSIPAQRMSLQARIQILAKTRRAPSLREVLCPRRAAGAPKVDRGSTQDAFLTDLGRRPADQHPLRPISPEPLQIVELAGLLVENMNDDILVVKQNPARLPAAFPGEP